MKNYLYRYRNSVWVVDATTDDDTNAEAWVDRVAGEGNALVHVQIDPNAADNAPPIVKAAYMHTAPNE